MKIRGRNILYLFLILLFIIFAGKGWALMPEEVQDCIIVLSIGLLKLAGIVIGLVLAFSLICIVIDKYHQVPGKIWKNILEWCDKHLTIN